MCLNETNSKIRVCKHLSVTFPIKNRLNQGHALPPTAFQLSPSKPGWTEIEWNTSLSGPCRFC